MRLKGLKDVEIAGKTVLYRSPYDIGTKEKGGQYLLSDDSRIRATLPTLKYLLERNCKIVVLTFVKRPDGKVVESLRTTPHAKALSKLLGRPVQKAKDCLGPAVRTEIAKMKPRGIIMLENTRFHFQEMIDDDGFARELARNGEIVVFDGFPQAHRIHASTTGILRHLPACAGFYLEEEVRVLSGLMSRPKRPFTVVIGGAKVSGKIEAINNLLGLADNFLLGGGMANVFLKARGKKMGASFIEDVFVNKARKEKKDWVLYAQKIFDRVRDQSLAKIQLPLDLVIGDSLENPRETARVRVGEKPEIVPDGWAALDVGLGTQEAFSRIIRQSKTVFWNGPMGKFEDERFMVGSKAIVEAMKNVKGMTVVAGGDTTAVVNKLTDLISFSHISLAGGATLEFLSGKKLPVLEMLLA